MKKKILSLVLAFVMLAAVLAACSKDASDAPADEEKSLLDEIKEKGEITIAMEGTWAPWTYYDESNELMGFDVEVGKAIAEYLGVEANFVTGDWDGLLAGLESGKYDIMINGVDVTEERKEKYNFSDAYAYMRTALIVRGDNTEITTFEDLDGKTTANSIGSTYMEMGEQYGAEVMGVDTLEETLSLVLAGRADATLNAEVSFYDYMNVHPDADLKVAQLTEDANLVAIPVRKTADCDSLLEEINKAIASIRESGELSEMSEKYFGTDITQE